MDLNSSSYSYIIDINELLLNSEYAIDLLGIYHSDSLDAFIDPAPITPREIFSKLLCNSDTHNGFYVYGYRSIHNICLIFLVELCILPE